MRCSARCRHTHTHMRRVKSECRVNSGTLQLLFDMPNIHHLLVCVSRIGHLRQALRVPSTSSLRHLDLDWQSDELHRAAVESAVESIIDSLVHVPIERLTLNTPLTSQAAVKVTALTHLTEFKFKQRTLINDTVLRALVSGEGRPVLPRLQLLKLYNPRPPNVVGASSYRSSLPSMIRAYSGRLRHLHLQLRIPKLQSSTVIEVLCGVVTGMPQLETLKFSAGDCQPVDRLPVPRREGREPLLPNLRYLELTAVPLSDSAFDQVLAECAHLLELEIAVLQAVTSACWYSLMHCPRLRLLNAQLGSAAFQSEAAGPSTRSSPTLPPTAAFPSLQWLSLGCLDAGQFGSAEQCAIIQRLFAHSPVRSYSMKACYGDEVLYRMLLAECWPDLRFMQVVFEGQQLEEESSRRSAIDYLIHRLLDECMEEQLHSAEQHHNRLQYAWRDRYEYGSEEEGEKMAVRIRDSTDASESYYRAFKPGGRDAFFRVLCTQLSSLPENTGGSSKLARRKGEREIPPQQTELQKIGW